MEFLVQKADEELCFFARNFVMKKLLTMFSAEQ